MDITKNMRLPATESNTRWLVWVNDEIWGWTETCDDAKHFLVKISENIKNRLAKENPSWEFTITDEECSKILRCIDRGYLYNTREKHIIRYESVYKLIRDPTPIYKTPSFEDIAEKERSADPITREPTPVAPPPPPLPRRRKRARRGGKMRELP